MDNKKYSACKTGTDSKKHCADKKDFGDIGYRKFLVLGGDRRNAEIANLLFEKGFNISVLGIESELLDRRIKKADFDSLSDFDTLFLPAPVGDPDGALFCPLSDHKILMKDVFSAVSPFAVIFAGRVSPQVSAFAETFGLSIIDLFKDPSLIWMNAVTTAEGAIALAINESSRSLFDAKVLVCGFGNVGKVLCHRLSGLLSRPLSVYARRVEVHTEAECFGFSSVKDLDKSAKDFDIIFNTVPSLLFSEDVLKTLSPTALIIDLASLPGGVDFEAAKSLGIKFVHALALPSKVAPVSAAESIIKVAVSRL